MDFFKYCAINVVLSQKFSIDILCTIPTSRPAGVQKSKTSRVSNFETTKDNNLKKTPL